MLQLPKCKGLAIFYIHNFDYFLCHWAYQSCFLILFFYYTYFIFCMMIYPDVLLDLSFGFSHNCIFKFWQICEIVSFDFVLADASKLTVCRMHRLHYLNSLEIRDTCYESIAYHYFFSEIWKFYFCKVFRIVNFVASPVHCQNLMGILKQCSQTFCLSFQWFFLWVFIQDSKCGNCINSVIV